MVRHQTDHHSRRAHVCQKLHSERPNHARNADGMTSGVKRSAALAGLASREPPSSVRACRDSRDSSALNVAFWQVFVSCSFDRTLHVVEVDPRCDVDDFRAAIRAKLSIPADSPLDFSCGPKFVSSGDGGFSISDVGLGSGSTVRVMPREPPPRPILLPAPPGSDGQDDHTMQRAPRQHAAYAADVAAVIASASAAAAAADGMGAAARRVASTAAAVGARAPSAPIAWQAHAAAMAAFGHAAAETAAAATRLHAADETMSSAVELRIDLHSRSGKRNSFSANCTLQHNAAWLADTLRDMCCTLDLADVRPPPPVEAERLRAAAVFAVRCGARYSLVATADLGVPVRAIGVLPAATPLREILGATAPRVDIVVQELA